jgi:hypothetical protein
MKVFKMNDYDWVTAQSKEQAQEWYLKEFKLEESDNPMDEVEECDIDKKGMWIPYENEEKIQEYESRNTLSIVSDQRKTTFGDIKKLHGEWVMFVPFREAMAIFNITKDSEPHVIASTEW